MTDEIAKDGAKIKHVILADMSVSAFLAELGRPKYKGCAVFGTLAVVFNPRGGYKGKRANEPADKLEVEAVEDDDE